MNAPVAMAEIWRGPFLESVHTGHAVVCGPGGEIIEAWGDPAAIVLPRSSSKMLQALPLVESGAAKAFGLTAEQLALSCASHQGQPMHTDRVLAWLKDLGLDDSALNCGPQAPRDERDLALMYKTDSSPCKYHNNCSGKHAGFLTLSQHLGSKDPTYVDPSHPVQRACLAAFEELTEETSPGYGIDGCSAPNHAASLHGVARAMAFFANASEGGNTREQAAVALRTAMATYPELVAGDGRACTELMRAMDGRVTLKTGAEAFFVGIVPEKKVGIALKIVDGSTRGAECAIASILVRLGVLDAKHPATQKRRNPPIKNFAGITTGEIRPAAALA
ncbi:asparaginase [Lentibacter algarum]|uniref:asparaginase n=1 Tax=Lentibacter algarum TaxID=576131 RepID=UPI001C07A630|nr:asparaginase [Lentibacter algarum]MBU2981281.1 asparaginase [Lentibacter algarum]